MTCTCTCTRAGIMKKKMIDTTGTQHGVHRAYNTALTQQLKKKKGKKNGHEEKKRQKERTAPFAVRCCMIGIS